MYHPESPPSPKESLPTMYDLPSEDPKEPGLPDEFHLLQPRLLEATCCPPNYPNQEIFTASDLNLYYDARHPLWYKRPDWFLVLGVCRAQRQEDLRLSYVIWQEAVAPFLVIELLSPGTEAEDLGQTLRELNQPPTKWQVYEQILRIPYYAVFDRYQNQLRAFRLVATCYEELPLWEQKLWFDEIELGLGVWQGSYEGTAGLWLRWFDVQGNWLPTPTERERQRAEEAQHQARQERQRAEEAHHQARQERQRAEEAHHQARQERQRAEQLAARLRELGIEPDEIP